MDIEPVSLWLKRTLNAAKLRTVLGSVASLLAGLLVLFLSFWVSYGVIWFLSHSFHRLSHPTILLISGAFMVLVVIVGARQNLADLDPLQRNVRLARDMDITLTPYTRYGMSYSTNAVKAGAHELD